MGGAALAHRVARILGTRKNDVCHRMKRIGRIKRIVCYVAAWLVLSLVAEAAFIPDIVAYNLHGYLGPPEHAYPGAGGDTYVGSVMGAIYSPILIAVVVGAAWGGFSLLACMSPKLICGRSVGWISKDGPSTLALRPLHVGVEFLGFLEVGQRA